MKQGHVARSLEILQNLIEERSLADIEKLHELVQYATYALQNNAFEQMQALFHSQKSLIVKYFDEKRKISVLQRASAFQALCSFKIAFLVKEKSSARNQNSIVKTVLSFVSFLDKVPLNAKSTVSWANALKIVVKSLLQLSHYLYSDEELKDDKS